MPDDLITSSDQTIFKRCSYDDFDIRTTARASVIHTTVSRGGTDSVCATFIILGGLLSLQSLSCHCTYEYNYVPVLCKLNCSTVVPQKHYTVHIPRWYLGDFWGLHLNIRCCVRVHVHWYFPTLVFRAICFCMWKRMYVLVCA